METLETIKDSKIIAIARGVYGEELLSASLALYEGGVRAFEVTFTEDVPRDRIAGCIAQLNDGLPDDCTVGAGTVLSPEEVRIAYDAGARLIVSPNTSRGVIEETKRLGMLSIPGAMTPTEIVFAHDCGADIVKLFPAGALGLEYFKAVRAPLKHIPLAAVAGITPENIGGFYRAGAAAFGISSSLYLKKAIGEGRYGQITEAARKFYKALS